MMDEELIGELRAIKSLLYLRRDFPWSRTIAEATDRLAELATENTRLRAALEKKNAIFQRLVELKPWLMAPHEVVGLAQSGLNVNPQPSPTEEIKP